MARRWLLLAAASALLSGGAAAQEEEEGRPLMLDENGNIVRRGGLALDENGDFVLRSRWAFDASGNVVRDENGNDVFLALDPAGDSEAAARTAEHAGLVRAAAGKWVAPTPESALRAPTPQRIPSLRPEESGRVRAHASIRRLAAGGTGRARRRAGADRDRRGPPRRATAAGMGGETQSRLRAPCTCPDCLNMSPPLVGWGFRTRARSTPCSGSGRHPTATPRSAGGGIRWESLAICTAWSPRGAAGSCCTRRSRRRRCRSPLGPSSTRRGASWSARLYYHHNPPEHVLRQGKRAVVGYVLRLLDEELRGLSGNAEVFRRICGADQIIAD